MQDRGNPTRAASSRAKTQKTSNACGKWMYRGTIQLGRRGVIFGAISGVDIALWDLLGKICGKPVCTLLGAA